MQSKINKYPTVSKVLQGQAQAQEPMVAYDRNQLQERRKYSDFESPRGWTARLIPLGTHPHPTDLQAHKALRSQALEMSRFQMYKVVPSSPTGYSTPHMCTNERHHFYLAAHHVYQTNGVERKHKATPNPASPYCRRSCERDGGVILAFGSHGYALYDCPGIQYLWNANRALVKDMVMQFELNCNPAQDQLCWSTIRTLPPVAIHLHVTVTQMIFRMYSKLVMANQCPTESSE